MYLSVCRQQMKRVYCAFRQRTGTRLFSRMQAICIECLSLEEKRSAWLRMWVTKCSLVFHPMAKRLLLPVSMMEIRKYTPSRQLVENRNAWRILQRIPVMTWAIVWDLTILWWPGHRMVNRSFIVTVSVMVFPVSFILSTRRVECPKSFLCPRAASVVILPMASSWLTTAPCANSVPGSIIKVVWRMMSGYTIRQRNQWRI